MSPEDEELWKHFGLFFLDEELRSGAGSVRRREKNVDTSHEKPTVRWEIVIGRSAEEKKKVYEENYTDGLHAKDGKGK